MVRTHNKFKIVVRQKYRSADASLYIYIIYLFIFVLHGLQVRYILHIYRVKVWVFFFSLKKFTQVKYQTSIFSQLNIEQFFVKNSLCNPPRASPSFLHWCDVFLLPLPWITFLLLFRR
jgi:hypothetical protein